MSERTAALGAQNPPRTITHNGKTYAIAPVLTHRTMALVEARLYERAKEALKGLRDAMDPAEYRAELEALRKRSEEGYYAFESEHTLALLQTTTGAVILLGCMMAADPGEILELLAAKPAEVEEALNEALELSFPAGALPKAPPLPAGRGRQPQPPAAP